MDYPLNWNNCYLKEFSLKYLVFGIFRIIILSGPPCIFKTSCIMFNTKFRFFSNEKYINVNHWKQFLDKLSIQEQISPVSNSFKIISNIIHGGLGKLPKFLYIHGRNETSTFSAIGQLFLSTFTLTNFLKKTATSKEEYLNHSKNKSLGRF